MESKRIDRIPFLFKLMFVLYVFQIPVSLLRVYRMNNLSFIWINFSYWFLVFITMLVMVRFIDFTQIVLDWFSIGLFSMCILGILVGLVNGNELLKVAIDTGRILFVLFSYMLYKNFNINDERVKKFYSLLSDIVFAVMGLAMLITYLYAIPKGWVTYLSVTSEIMFVPLAYYFFHSKYKRFFLSVLITVLSTKRGVIVSALVMTIMMLISKKEKKFSSVVVKTILLFFSVLLAIVILLYTFYPLLSSEMPAFRRWEALIPWSEKFNIRIAGSGRIEEVIYALKHLYKQPLGLFIGSGHGASYELVYNVGSTSYIYKGYRNVHISPFAMVLLYGFPMTACFYTAIITKLTRVHRRIHSQINDGNRMHALVLIYVSIGMLLYTNFAFELLQEPILWCSLGMVSSLEKKKLSG